MLKKLDCRKTHRAFIPAMLIQILVKNVEVERKPLKMEISTMVNGIATKQMGKASSGTKMAISTRDIGKMERLKAMDFTKHKVAVVISETGTMIYNMVTEKKLGQTDLSMKENIAKAQNKEKVSTNTWMAPSTKVIGFKTQYKGLVLTLGQMEKFLQVNGRRITCMVKVYSAGLMEDNMRVNIATTKKKDLESILGPTGDNTLDNGKMASNMVREYIKTLTI
jgi:hypothetical protein